MEVFRLTIEARTKAGLVISPKTKKNSAVITLKNHKRPILLPSAAYREWEAAARRVLIHDGTCRKAAEGKKLVYSGRQITWPVNCRALIYREINAGDAVGFYQGLGDFLEHAGIVSNDRLIVSWDGSRLLKDVVRPRIEIELSPVEAAAPLFA